MSYWYGVLSVIDWKKYRKKPYVLLLTVSILLTQPGLHYFSSETYLRLRAFLN